MIELYDEAESIPILGIEVYRFGVFVMLGMALSAACIAFLCWAKRAKKGTAPLLTLSAFLLGGIFSRIFFCLLCFDNMGGMIPFRAWFRITGGGWSMMGLVAGALCAGWLTARLTRQKTGVIMDMIACALPVFMAAERFGEGAAEEFDYGLQLRTGLLNKTFLAMEDIDGEVLVNWKLAAILMLLLTVVLVIDLMRSRRDGNTCLLFLLLFGACSILLESFRNDNYLTVKAFIGFQHILAAVYLAAGVFVLALRADKRRKKLASFAMISVILMVGLAVALEFALDRTTWNKILLYALYVLIAAAPVALALRLRKAESENKLKT